MRYTKQNPRLTVKFIDADTEKVLFELKDRTWMNIGEILSDQITTTLMEQELKGKNLPKNLMILVVGKFKLE
jgi:hypothetical protein